MAPRHAAAKLAGLADGRILPGDAARQDFALRSAPMEAFLLRWAVTRTSLAVGYVRSWQDWVFVVGRRVTAAAAILEHLPLPDAARWLLVQFLVPRRGARRLAAFLQRTAPRLL